MQRLEVGEFSGLRSSSCVTYASNGRETSFFDAVAAQLTPKVLSSHFFHFIKQHMCLIEQISDCSLNLNSYFEHLNFF